MNFRWSLKAGLAVAAGLATIALAGLTGYDAWSATRDKAKLAGVYERRVAPAHTLLQIDATLRDLRFRAAAVLLDQMPRVGSLQHAKEAQESLPALWKSFPAPPRKARRPRPSSW